MSSEVVKKRGRPKKVISDPVEIEMPKDTKKTTRAKSTKAAPKVVKPAPPTSAKPATSEKTAWKPIANNTPPAKAVSKPPPSPATSSQKATPTPTKPIQQIKVAPPESSKILNELRTQYPKTAPAAADSAKYTKPSAPAPAAKTSYPTPQSRASPAASTPPKSFTKQAPPPQKPAPTAARSAPAAVKATPPPPSTKPIPKPHIPVAGLNSEIVSNIATRAGARPNVASSPQLGKEYKRVANKVTMAIVAMPIALVTSWVLYERFVLGEERKLLVAPGMSAVDTPEEKPATEKS